jgi:hypothetical protein
MPGGAFFRTNALNINKSVPAGIGQRGWLYGTPKKTPRKKSQNYCVYFKTFTNFVPLS